MTAPAFRVGDTVIHVERPGWRTDNDREICRVTIARETRTQWIDSHGTRWRKSDGSQTPQYIAPRFIVPAKAPTE